MQSLQRVSGDCINASFQGYFNPKLLQQQQQLTGIGVVLDDDLNLFLSQWANNQLNGSSLLRLSNSQLICANFNQGRPDGPIAVHTPEFSIFVIPTKTGKGCSINWEEKAIAVNNRLNLLYVLHITPKIESHSQKKAQREEMVFSKRTQWKVTIIERCPLKSDGSIGVQSSIVKQMEDLSGAYSLTRKEKNIVGLVKSVLGQAVQDETVVSPVAFLKGIQRANTQVEVKQFEEGDSDMLFIELPALGKPNQTQKNIGMMLNSNGKVQSLGWYDHSKRLQGPGVQIAHQGSSMTGFFKEGLLVREWGQSQLRKWLSSDHLKSLTFMNQCFFIETAGSISDLGGRIGRYVLAFEREFQKRQLNFNDTPLNHSTTQDTHNIRKYMEPSYSNTNNSLLGNPTSSQSQLSKKPGFIRNKRQQRSGSRSRSKSPGVIFNRTSSQAPAVTGKSTAGSIRSIRNYSYFQGVDSGVRTASREHTARRYP